MLKRNLIAILIVALSLILAGNSIAQTGKRRKAARKTNKTNTAKTSNQRSSAPFERGTLPPSAKSNRTTNQNSNQSNLETNGNSRTSNSQTNNRTQNPSSTNNSSNENQRRRGSVNPEDLVVVKVRNENQTNQQTPGNSQTNILPYLDQNNLRTSPSTQVPEQQTVNPSATSNTNMKPVQPKVDRRRGRRGKKNN